MSVRPLVYYVTKRKKKASAFASHRSVTSRSVVLLWLVDWCLGHAVEKSVLCAKLGAGGGRGGGVAHVLRFPAERVLRRAHIGQTLGSWDFNELHALDCKSKKALAST
jgi:hypothetical protein